MKSIFFTLTIIMFINSFTAKANDFSCYLLLTESSDQIYSLSHVYKNGYSDTNEYDSRLKDAYSFGYLLAKDKYPPNEYLMSLTNLANLYFKSLEQNAYSITNTLNYINLPKLKNEFNNCISENVKNRCSKEISSFNNSINLVLTNQNDAKNEFQPFASLNKKVFSTFQNDFENQIALDFFKMQNDHTQLLGKSQTYRFKLDIAHEASSHLHKIVSEDLPDCMRR